MKIQVNMIEMETFAWGIRITNMEDEGAKIVINKDEIGAVVDALMNLKYHKETP